MYNTTGTGSTLKYIVGSPRKNDGSVDGDVVLGFGGGNDTPPYSTTFNNITNITKIAESTVSYESITGEAALIAAVDAVITSATTSTNVQFTANPANKVIAFVTASGKKGLVKIVSATGEGGNPGVAGSAVLKVKVTK